MNCDESSPSIGAESQMDWTLNSEQVTEDKDVADCETSLQEKSHEEFCVKINENKSTELSVDQVSGTDVDFCNVTSEKNSNEQKLSDYGHSLDNDMTFYKDNNCPQDFVPGKILPKMFVAQSNGRNCFQNGEDKDLTRVKIFECPVCAKQFSINHHFQRHMRIHSGEKPFLCAYCEKSFNCQSNLSRHLITHTDEKPYPCTICGKSFRENSSLRNHFRIHTGEKPFKCAFCGESFSQKYNLKTHMKIHVDENPVQCHTFSGDKNIADCETSLEKKSREEFCVNIDEDNSTELPSDQVSGKDTESHCHASLENNSNDQKISEKASVAKSTGRNCLQKGADKDLMSVKILECPVCAKQFSIHHHFERHMRIHSGEKPFLCAYCDKSFNCQSNLTRHIRSHTDEKAYICSICGKAFRDNSNLKDHFRIHTGEKPFKCVTCGESFSQKHSLKSHMKNHISESSDLSAHVKTDKDDETESFTNSGEKPFQCQFCGKSVLKKYDLTVHLRTHTGERPFVCSICEKTFAQKSSLLVHIRTHTGEKPYECLTCEWKFPSHSALKRHERKHTGEKPFKCLTCEKKFSSSTILKTHERTHSGEKPFQCLVCEKAYSHKPSLELHMKIHSG